MSTLHQLHHTHYLHSRMTRGHLRSKCTQYRPLVLAYKYLYHHSGNTPLSIHLAKVVELLLSLELKSHLKRSVPKDLKTNLRNDSYS
jgi:hypothetical protein